VTCGKVFSEELSVIQRMHGEENGGRISWAMRAFILRFTDHKETGWWLRRLQCTYSRQFFYILWILLCKMSKVDV